MRFRLAELVYFTIKFSDRSRIFVWDHQTAFSKKFWGGKNISNSLQEHLKSSKQVGSIHTCDLFGVNYCANCSLNSVLYCTEWAHSHLFGQYLCGMKSSLMGYVPIFAIAWTEVHTIAHA